MLSLTKKKQQFLILIFRKSVYLRRTDEGFSNKPKLVLEDLEDHLSDITSERRWNTQTPNSQEQGLETIVDYNGGMYYGIYIIKKYNVMWWNHWITKTFMQRETSDSLIELCKDDAT